MCLYIWFSSRPQPRWMEGLCLVYLQHPSQCWTVNAQTIFYEGMRACVCSVMFDSFATTRTVARQAALSIGFFRQEYWSRLPFPSPGDHSNSEIEPVCPESPALAGKFFTTLHLGSTHERINTIICQVCLHLHMLSSPVFCLNLTKKQGSGVNPMISFLP